MGGVSDDVLTAHPHRSLQLAVLSLTPLYGVAILLFLLRARVLRREDIRSRGNA